MKLSSNTNPFVLLVVMIIAAVSGCNLRPYGSMAFTGGTQVVLTDDQGSDPIGAPPGVEGADLVARGEYLARAADCIGCHTTPRGTPVAGEQAVKRPIGTRHSTNITPDQVAKHREEE